MITLKEYLETVDYRITEGSEYYCNVFGNNLYCLSAWNGDHDGWSTNIVFGTTTQTSYMVEVCDYKNNRAYRLINPNYKNSFMKDDTPNRDQAWDDVSYVDLETDDDWLQKTQAIINGEEYDTRICIPVDLSDKELMYLFQMAHERDMTFNDFINEILTEQLQKMEKDLQIKDLIQKDIL